jgi:hypothetical protein
MNKIVLKHPDLLKSGWFFLILTLLTTSRAWSQASVGYYPWNGLLTISTNCDRALWADVRMQTNTLFGSLSTELLPMINVSRSEVANFYVGGGVRFNFIGVIAGQTNNVVEGYLLNIGARVAPFQSNRNVRIAFELSPFVERQLDSGVLKTNFGIVYVFKKRK